MQYVCGAASGEQFGKGQKSGQSFASVLRDVTLGSESRDSDMKIIRIPGF